MLKVGNISLRSPVALICQADAPIPEVKDLGFLILQGLNGTDDIGALIRELDIPVGLSFRSPSSKGLSDNAKLAADHNWLVEIDLSDRDSLDINRVSLLLKMLKSAGATTSLRISPEALNKRTNPDAIKSFSACGLDMLHLDLRGYDGSALTILKNVSDARGPKIMALANIKSFDDAKRLLAMGADMISLNGLKDVSFASRLSTAIRRFDEITGWYNAPKHICAGGDLRGLAFCCPPVKPCPVHGALRRLGITAEEFVRRKLELARGTPLEKGDGTCFGSLIWCCKITKPCYMRDAALRRAGLTPKEYMILKRRVAEGLLKQI